MTDEEILAYFEAAILPETIRLDRATTQFNVKEAVQGNITLMLADPKNDHPRHRLRRIANAMENPYNGPEIPRF